MSIEDDLALLRNVPSLALLGTDALRVIAIGAEQRSLARGEVLYRSGETAPAGYAVQSGSFSVTTDDGDEIVAGPGDLFGQTALLVETKWSTTATALDEAVVMRISRTLFQRVLEGHPDAARRMRDDFIARSTSATRDIVAVRQKLG
jgi:CRP-like cAMP-binding protein